MMTHTTSAAMMPRMIQVEVDMRVGSPRWPLSCSSLPDPGGGVSTAEIAQWRNVSAARWTRWRPNATAPLPLARCAIPKSMSDLSFTILPETADDALAIERLHERTFGP